MSVGHAYMHSLFPLPKLPSIPPDFDHCLLEVPLRADGGSEQNQASGSNPPSSHPANDSSSGASTPFLSADPVIDQGIEEDCCHEVDLADEPGSGDCDYLDDMNDRDILFHEEMYGEI